MDINNIHSIENHLTKIESSLSKSRVSFIHDEVSRLIKDKNNMHIPIDDSLKDVVVRGLNMATYRPVSVTIGTIYIDFNRVCCTEAYLIVVYYFIEFIKLLHKYMGDFIDYSVLFKVFKSSIHKNRAYVNYSISIEEK